MREKKREIKMASPESGWDMMARFLRLAISFRGATYDSSSEEAMMEEEDASSSAVVEKSNVLLSGTAAWGTGARNAEVL